VLDRLMDGNAADAAVNAREDVMERLGGDIGLNRAAEAVGGDVDSPDLPVPDLPDVVENHPGRP